MSHNADKLAGAYRYFSGFFLWLGLPFEGR